MFTTRYQQLNPAQRQAVDTIDGPVLVIAGPGSGKTELLGMRVANILRTTDTIPQSILCLTFTDAAAKNMRKRLRSLIGEDAYKVSIHTFHSFGRDIINSYPEYFYGGARMETADDLKCYEIIETLISQLPIKDPLRSFHPEQGHIYLRSIRSNISNLKKNGIFPQELASIVESNETFLSLASPLCSEFFGDRISKGLLANIPSLITRLHDLPAEQPLPHIGTIKKQWLSELQHIIEADSTKPLTAWKNQYFEKDEGGALVAKDLIRVSKMKSLAHLYEEYNRAMYTSGLVDFDDLLMETNKALEHHEELRANLEERYLYIHVDEFQDTSGVQMRLINNITSNPIHEGRPNILAVGDDDQSIFKFQGANLDNILSFGTTYRESTIVVLQENYRSTKPILDLAEAVIEHSTERLTSHFDISKTQRSNTTDLGNLTYIQCPSRHHEAMEVAQRITALLREKTAPSEIALLARSHKDLMLCSEVMTTLAIPHNYERQENVFELPPIKDLILILETAHSIYNHTYVFDQSLIPTLCAMPCFAIKEEALWKLSIDSYQHREPWISTMLKSEEESLVLLGKFILHLSVKAKQVPLMELIDMAMGTTECIFDDDQLFRSPLKKHHFSDITTSYVKYLEALRTLHDQILERHGEYISLGDFLTLIKKYASYNISLSLQSTWEQDGDKVTLLSAHKSKGLEFDHVFVIGASEEQWHTKGMSSNLPFPSNLPLLPPKDNPEDVRRLFFVAITRAKTHLTLSMPLAKDNGKEQSSLSYITTEWQQQYASQPMHHLTDHLDTLEDVIMERLPKDSTTQEEILTTQLQGFSLSASKLTQFINIVDHTPEEVTRDMLLHFPRSPIPQMSYGNVIHSTLHDFHVSYKTTGVVPSLEHVLSTFEEKLKKEHMTPQDKEDYALHGQEVIHLYHKGFSEHPSKDFLSEYDLGKEHIHIGDVPVRGVIDFLSTDVTNKSLTITDFKTGKALYHLGNQKYTSHSIKALSYKLQLTFYAAMLKYSSKYHSYTDITGCIHFVQPSTGTIHKPEIMITPRDIQRMEHLIKAVYTRIMSLDFPDTTIYSQNMKGVLAFIDDLEEEGRRL